MIKILVKKGEHTLKVFLIDKGPVTIGRGTENKIRLPSKAVSREHALINIDEDANIFLKDLGSANKTYLNDKPIDHTKITIGDNITIAEYTLQLAEPKPGEKTQDAEEADSEETLLLQASLTTPKHETVVRKPDAQHAPSMRLPAHRLTDFAQATESICKAHDLDELLKTLLDLLTRQFSAYHVWCGLREEPSGPMIYSAGKRRDGKKLDYENLPLKEKVEQAIKQGRSLVLPWVSAKMELDERIRSALITPIKRKGSCYGIFYVDNAMVHDHFKLGDLDYLMLLAMHTAAVLFATPLSH